MAGKDQQIAITGPDGSVKGSVVTIRQSDKVVMAYIGGPTVSNHELYVKLNPGHTIVGSAMGGGVYPEHEYTTQDTHILREGGRYKLYTATMHLDERLPPRGEKSESTYYPTLDALDEAHPEIMARLRAGVALMGEALAQEGRKTFSNIQLQLIQTATRTLETKGKDF